MYKHNKILTTCKQIVGIDSPREILSKSGSDLERSLLINSSQAQEILKAASTAAYDWRTHEKVGYDLQFDNQDEDSIMATPNVLTTGDKTIDKILHGGIPLGTITEVVGESSSGKSQLALQLCLTVQKPQVEGGLEGSAVYIHSEGPFPSARLEQMVSKQYPNNKEEVKNRIHTIRVTDSEEQYRVLAYQLPIFLELQKQKKTPVRVVVIDSISCLYRGESTLKRFEKMKEICEIGTKLKKMATDYNLAVIVVNQVSDTFFNSDKAKMDYMQNWMDFTLVNQSEHLMIGLYIESLLKKPSLGLSWSNSVNTRIRLARSPMVEGMLTRRVLFIEFSPIAGRLGCEITIGEEGLKSI